MDFGRIPREQLNKIDFYLPDDPVDNLLVLNTTKLHPKVFIGLDKWDKREWLHQLYPWKIKEKDFLREYSRSFNTVELNATHYRTYSQEEIQIWKDKVKGMLFLFSPKMLNEITHSGSLDKKEELTRQFIRSVNTFEEHLGPVLIQFPDKFSSKRKHELITYLKSLPEGVQYFLEIRNADWFNDTSLLQEIVAILRKLNIGLVITDVAGRRDVLHMHLPISKAYIRFVSNDNHPSDYVRIDEWLYRIRKWLHSGLQEVYFYIHGNVYAPELIKYAIERFNTFCSLNIKEVQLQEELLKKTNQLLVNF
jgi:uncharacterized protein YecE (DUF72 family)